MRDKNTSQGPHCQLSVLMSDSPLHFASRKRSTRRVPDTDSYAARLGRALSLRGLSANELERRAGLGSGYVTHAVKGRRPNPQIKQALALCRILEVRPEWLLFGEEPMQDIDPGPHKPNLEKVLVALSTQRGWSKPAIAAARAYPADRELSEWPRLLDRLDVVLAQADATFTQDLPPKRPRGR